MAYLHCHTKGCGWSQDDFWDRDRYNPFRQDIIDSMKEKIFLEKVYMDSSFFKFDATQIPAFHDEKGCYCKGTDLVSWDLERIAKNIRNMSVKTSEEWEEIRKIFVCPKCGKRDFDID